MRTTCLLVAALVIGAQGPSLAAARDVRFLRVDKNGDGEIAAEELGMPAAFEAADTDGNAFVSPEEFAAFMEKWRGGSKDRAKTASARPARVELPESVVVRRDLRYCEMPGVEVKFHSLDVYAPKAAKNAPVLAFIHGGGWRGGDKGNPPVGAGAAAFFCAEGFVYVSINYRLTPAGKHPANIQDVAKAVAWVHDHIAEHGGDPNRISVAGHSAGGHLAALIATDPKRLRAEGKDLNILKSAVLLDPAAYDIPRYLKELAPPNGGMKRLYESAFGNTEEDLHDGSPQSHIASGKSIPPMLIFYAGDRMAADTLAPALADALTKAGAPARAVDTVTLSHGEILSTASEKGHPLSQLILRFLRGEDVRTFPGKLEAAAKAVAPTTPAARSANPESAASKSANPDTNNTAPFPAAFTRDYTPGTKDRHGQFMGGTETMRIASHHGMLFAGLGFWTDQPGRDPQPGAQILVKRGPAEPWEVERNFPGALRINCMEPVTFTTDAAGKPLSKPVALLFADAALVTARDEGSLSVWVREDGNGTWLESRITDKAARAYVRAFGLHHDSKTGVDLVFAGTGAGEIYAGVFDPAAPGRIRWNSRPEYANPDFDGGSFRRCQGFCVANGKAYASISPSLVERCDGPLPTWVEVFCWKPQEARAGQGLRGITAVPDPKGGQHEVILGSREQEGRILRIDPLDNYRVDLELQSDEFLKEKLGEFRGGKLVAYNRFEPGTDPRTGAPIHWVTVAGYKPDDPKAAWLMIRRANGTYEQARVFDPSLRDHPALFSTRTLETAPWNPLEIYTGGYDGAANNRKNHNTAWIYKGTLKAKP